MFNHADYASTNIDDHQYIEDIGDHVGALISEHPRDRATIVKALEGLRRALNLHFTIEENLMSDLRYEGLADHHLSHLLILSEISDHLKAIASGAEEPGAGLWPQVKSILRHHMRSHDSSLALTLERGTFSDGALSMMGASVSPPLLPH